MFPALYAILDPSVIKEPLAEFAAKLSEAGVELMQLRDKRASARKIHVESHALVERFSSAGAGATQAVSQAVKVIVNDRPDIAAMVGAGGVHIGQQDLPVEAARAICGNSCWVGVSTHNLAQLREAARTSADYIAVGPVFPTATKENPDPVVGIEFLRLARRETRKPLVAIGGITIESAAEVFRAGADSVALVRDLIEAPNPAQRAREYLEIAERSRSGRA